MAQRYEAYCEQIKRRLAEEKEKLRKEEEDLAHIKDVADKTCGEYISIKSDNEEIRRLIEQQQAILNRNRKHLDDELLNFGSRSSGALKQMDDVMERYDSEREGEREFLIRTFQELKDIPRKFSNEAFAEKTKEVLLTIEARKKDIEEESKNFEEMRGPLNAEVEELEKRYGAISEFLSELKLINVKLEAAKLHSQTLDLN